VSTSLGAQNGWFGKSANLLLRPFLDSPEKGARTLIYACVSPELEGVTGCYLRNCREEQPKPWATDDAAAQRLWEVSVKLTDLPASQVARP
jgi:hypothetical protein